MWKIYQQGVDMMWKKLWKSGKNLMLLPKIDNEKVFILFFKNLSYRVIKQITLANDSINLTFRYGV